MPISQPHWAREIVTQVGTAQDLVASLPFSQYDVNETCRFPTSFAVYALVRIGKVPEAGQDPEEGDDCVRTVQPIKCRESEDCINRDLTWHDMSPYYLSKSK